MAIVQKAVRRAVQPALRRLGYAVVYDNDYEKDAQRVMVAAEAFTMTTWPRLYALSQSVRHIVQAGVPGAIVECGVWRWGSMYAAALTLTDLGVADRDLYLCDTFEGMTPPTADDVDALGQSAADLMTLDNSDDATIGARAPLTRVKRLMAESGYPAERIHYVVGDVRQTLPRDAPGEIPLLRLDTDWYESTRHELDALFDRLSFGAVVIIDDYRYWQGSRKAVDELLAERGVRLLPNRVDSGCRVAVVGQ